MQRDLLEQKFHFIGSITLNIKHREQICNIFYCIGKETKYWVWTLRRSIIYMRKINFLVHYFILFYGPSRVYNLEHQFCLVEWKLNVSVEKWKI